MNDFEVNLSEILDKRDCITKVGRCYPTQKRKYTAIILFHIFRSSFQGPRSVWNEPPVACLLQELHFLANTLVLQ